MTIMHSEGAIDKLLSGNYKEISNELSIETHPLECAYILFLKGDIRRVLDILSSIDSIRANWLRELVNLVATSKMQNVTYFQIRNFLELDIDLFIKSERVDYLETLLCYADKLSEVNNESYKLIARVLFNDKLYSLSKYYLDKYKDLIYYDPELHFIYAKYYIHEKDYCSALQAINRCLQVLPAYYPAIKLRDEIQYCLSNVPS